MGDPHFTISNSLGLSQVVVAPDFSLSVSSAQPVSAGSPAVYTITVSPFPSPFIYPVTNFNCTGLPTGAACSVKPVSVTPNNSSVTTMLTISTTSRTLALASPSNESQRLLFAGWLTTGMLGLFSIVAMSDKRQRRAMRLWLTLALIGSALGVGCATGSQGNSPPPPNPNGTPAGIYSVTLSASGNGNTNHSTTVVLKVN
jgi:hypothetical protein